MKNIFVRTAVVVTFIATGALADDQHDAVPKAFKGVKIVFDQPLPNVPGKSMRGVQVDYEPGRGSPAHLHPKSAFIYATVIKGAIRSKVNDGPVITYSVGENWSERPGDHHWVSQNASETEPARLLAVFVVDTDETEIVKPLED